MQARNLVQSLERPAGQIALVLLDPCIRQVQAAGPVAVPCPQRLEVRDRGHEARQRLVAERAGFETMAGRHLQARGRTPVGRQRARQVGCGRRRPRGAVRSICRRRSAARRRRGRRDRRAGAVRGARRRPTTSAPARAPPLARRPASGIEPSAFDASVNATTRVRAVISSFERVQVERAVARLESCRPDGEVAVAGDQQPGRYVGIVVDLGDDDLVARFERPRHRVREQEVDRGRVGAEHDLFLGAAEEVGRGQVSVDAPAARCQPRSRTGRRGSRSRPGGSRRPLGPPSRASASRLDRPGRPPGSRRLGDPERRTAERMLARSRASSMATA